jgi:glycolate oxidase iron-sulfur subunit
LSTTVDPQSAETADSIAAETVTELVGSHIDRCLGSMACVTACPSGVKYDLLFQQIRPQVERNFRRSRGDRAFRQLVLSLFPHPGRLRLLVPALVLQRRTHLERLLPSRLRRLRAMAAMAPQVPLRAAWQSLPAVTAARGEKRGTVALLQGCVQRVFFSEVNRATVDVLSAEGYEVHAPRAPRCCGSLQLHTGYGREAQVCARKRSPHSLISTPWSSRCPGHCRGQPGLRDPDHPVSGGPFQSCVRSSCSPAR